MTDTRHEQPRCPICRWPYRPGGCTPAQCQNPEPEDVDAELQPKGLPVIAWDRKTVAWLGDWHPDPFMRDVWRRLVIEGPSRIAAASVFKIDDGFAFSVPVYPHPAQAAYPTPEAAQAACEAAIVAAWRNR